MYSYIYDVLFNQHTYTGDSVYVKINKENSPYFIDSWLPIGLGMDGSNTHDRFIRFMKMCENEMTDVLSSNWILQIAYSSESK